MKELTCREFEEAVHEFVRIELLDVDMREAVLEHSAHCERCAERMADAADLAEASELAGKILRHEDAPAHVEKILLAAYRNHHQRASWRRMVEWGSVGAAAAVLLIFLWTATWHSRGQSSSPAPSKEISAQSGSRQEAAVRASTNQGEANAASAGSVNEPVVVEIPRNESYVASDFVPVPFTGAIDADDPGMIVRVQLTRASLAQLGYPVAETPDEDLILADVLVGEDGWPRGVKLIQ